MRINRKARRGCKTVIDLTVRARVPGQSRSIRGELRNTGRTRRPTTVDGDVVSCAGRRFESTLEGETSVFGFAEDGTRLHGGLALELERSLSGGEIVELLRDGDLVVAHAPELCHVVFEGAPN